MQGNNASRACRERLQKITSPLTRLASSRLITYLRNEKMLVLGKYNRYTILFGSGFLSKIPCEFYNCDLFAKVVPKTRNKPYTKPCRTGKTKKRAPL